MNLNYIEQELKKRLNYEYKWGRKQSDDWDKKTSFIYKIDNFDNLLEKMSNMCDDVKNYAMNRWYNFWSAKAVEYMFATHSNVTPNKDIYDKLVDFKINDVSFDHKTSVFPRGFNKSFEYAKQNKKELIEWLYKNQSQQGRKHLENRLFIVLYDSISNEHWKLKSELNFLKDAIDRYLNNFNKNNLVKLNLEKNKTIYSDIIFIEK